MCWLNILGILIILGFFARWRHRAWKWWAARLNNAAWRERVRSRFLVDSAPWNLITWMIWVDTGLSQSELPVEDTIQITQERTALASLFCHHMHVVFMTFMCSATANLYLSWCISWQLRLQEVEYGLELGGTITIDLQNRILGVPGGPEMGIRVQLVGITQPVRRSILDILLGSELPPLISLMGMLSTSSPSNFSHEMETTMSLFTFSTIFPSQLVAFIPRSSQLVVFGELYQKAP